MAYNPSPEVRAAAAFGEKFGSDQVIVLYVDRKTGRVGYASWGRTRALCDQTRELADMALGAVTRSR